MHINQGASLSAAECAARDEDVRAFMQTHDYQTGLAALPNLPLVLHEPAAVPAAPPAAVAPETLGDAIRACKRRWLEKAQVLYVLVALMH